MILAALLTVNLLPAQDVNPAQVISKMLAYYHGATSMSGKIKMTQSILNRVAVIDTTFQFEAPAKIYISQIMTAPFGSEKWLVTGDGVGFSYTPPRFQGDSRTQNRLYEPVQLIPAAPRNKNEAPMPTPPPLDFRQIYGIVGKSIGDRTLPLDVAFARNEDLAFLKKQIVTMNHGAAESAGGVACAVITGKWRDIQMVDSAGNIIQNDNGTYALWITGEGELKKFQRRELIDLRDQNVRGEVVSTWEVDIKKGAILDPKLFTVVLK